MKSTHPEYDVECEESELDTRVAGKCSSSPTVSTASTAAEASSQTHRRSSWSVCTAECAECRGLDSIANIHAAYSYFCNVTYNQTLSQQSTKCNVTDLLCPRPDRREGGNKSVAFVGPSVAYIANNSTTQRPSVPKFGWKDQHLDATRIPVSRSNCQRSGLEAGGGMLCRPNPAATLPVSTVLVLS